MNANPGRPPLEPRILRLEQLLDTAERRINALELRLTDYDEAALRGTLPRPPIKRLDI